jgi:hypothetical protein
MIRISNRRSAADAGLPLCLHIGGLWSRAADSGGSARLALL